MRNSNDASESTNPADYIWYQASGGFGTTKFLWYISTGGRQIQFAVATAAPDSGWVVDPGSSIDLDIVTSNTAPVIAEAFVTFFSPPTLQVPRSGNPLAPVFTGIVPRLYATDQGVIVPFTDAQTDSAVSFVNNSWRIGNSSTTGNGDISYTNLTIGAPTDGGDFAEWPNPTAMPSSPAYITVPVRYKNSSGIVSQASVATCQLIYGDPGPTGSAGPTVDISGYVSFVQNTGGAFTPPNTALSALIQNITSPTYSWAISGATPTTSTSSTVVITPTSLSTGVTVTLTVNGSNLASPLSKTISLPVVYDGAAGTAGANGIMSAFPTIYIWTGSSSTPTRPSTTSTYTWSSGSFSAPAGWYTEPPSNTTAGNYLWAITIPLNVSATTTTSTLDWTNVAYPIRAIAYNGANGAAGTPGTNGTNGAATFVVVRTANDSSPPTNTEVNAVIGRNPVAGDIVTVSYNSSNNAVVYRYTTSWVTQATYLTGSLIVDGTITGNKIAANTITATNIAASTITSTQIAAATISATNMAANSITAANAAIADATITSAKIGTAEVATLNIAGQAVTLPVVSFSASGISFGSGTQLQTITWTSSGAPTLIMMSTQFSGPNSNPPWSNAVEVVIDSSVVATYAFYSAAGPGTVLTILYVLTSPSSGSHTAIFRNGTAGTSGGTASQRTIFVLETKR